MKQRLLNPISLRISLLVLVTILLSSWVTVPFADVLSGFGASGILEILGINFCLAVILVPVALLSMRDFVSNGRMSGELSDDVRSLEQRLKDAEQTKENALRISRLRSEFFANMSHEIRTPLNGILGLTDAMAAGEKDSDRLDSLQAIKRSGSRLLHLINEILEMSKIEAHRMVVHPAPVSIADLVKEAAATIEVGCRQKGIALHVDVTAEIPAVINVDGHKLVRVLINLLGNALKFTDRGSISVRACQNKGGRRGDILFEIADTGRGISAGKKESIFESFIQGGMDDDASDDGTGLGLPIAHGLVELLGGEIWVESRLGEGSAFYFTIKKM